LLPYKLWAFLHVWRVVPDIILQRESEVILQEFLKEFEATGSYRTSLPGFVYKNSQGEIIDTGEPNKPKRKHLDIVANGSIYGDDYSPLIGTFTSRGCINKCTFCSEWLTGKPLRKRSAESVVKEIVSLKGRTPNSKDVWLLDSNFNTSKQHVVDFCETMIEKRINLSWKAMGCFRVDLDTEIRLIRFLRT
jgi:anaerobic magnesium-protoporphyrin IX monomethyl ester cyclase